jgi:hypothetical protein
MAMPGKSLIIKTATIDGKPIEIHEDRYGARRYWAMVDGTALFQRGRMRLRMFTTAEAAWKAAIKEAKSTRPARRTRGVPGYSNFGGGGPFAPMASPSKVSKEKP